MSYPTDPNSSPHHEQTRPFPVEPQQTSAYYQQPVQPYTNQPVSQYSQYPQHLQYPQPMRAAKPARETWLAYLLWFLIGGFGIHKFYLEQMGMGVLYIVFNIVGWVLAPVLIGLLLLIPLWIMLFVDLFSMPSRIRKVNYSYGYY